MQLMIRPSILRFCCAFLAILMFWVLLFTDTSKMRTREKVSFCLFGLMFGYGAIAGSAAINRLLEKYVKKK